MTIVLLLLVLLSILRILHDTLFVGLSSSEPFYIVFSLLHSKAKGLHQMQAESCLARNGAKRQGMIVLGVTRDSSTENRHPTGVSVWPTVLFTCCLLT